MNKKAEEFKAYVEETHPQTFTIEEIPDDAYETVVFRSFAEVRGNRLPLVVILDTSIYAMIRILDLAGAYELDLGGALVEKLVYNTQRADHKREARAADDGKKF